MSYWQLIAAGGCCCQWQRWSRQLTMQCQCRQWLVNKASIFAPHSLLDRKPLQLVQHNVKIDHVIWRRRWGMQWHCGFTVASETRHQTHHTTISCGSPDSKKWMLMLTFCFCCQWMNSCMQWQLSKLEISGEVTLKADQCYRYNMFIDCKNASEHSDILSNICLSALFMPQYSHAYSASGRT